MEKLLFKKGKCCAGLTPINRIRQTDKLESGIKVFFGCVEPLNLTFTFFGDTIETIQSEQKYLKKTQKDHQ